MKRIEDLWLALPRPVQYVLVAVAVLTVITFVYRLVAGLPLIG